MKISHGTRITDINDTNGYGYATVNMIDSLRRLGHEINPNDPSAPVEIWFDQPQHWKFRDAQYKIGYHPWESTQLKEGWIDIMNTCDEIWTPSPLIAEWYKDDGVKVPVYVYEHGVDPIWTPKKRERSDVIKFLHCGGEAARKVGNRTMEAFRLAFPDRDDVQLTMKMISPGWNIPFLGKIHVLNHKMGLQELVDLYHSHHVYLYPSYGEGFGLTPLQAMATGMPTITVPAWAPYSDFMLPALSIPSKLKNSPWPVIHPGKMFRPDFDELVDILRYTVDNYEDLSTVAMEAVPAIQEKYSWDRLTKEAFDGLQSRL